MARASLTQWLALVGLSLLSFTAFLDYTIVATALPFIQIELHASVLQLQWVMNIMLIVLCMFMIVSGQAGDLFGRQKIFYLGFILFAFAAIGAGWAPTIQWLIFFRGIQGLGAGIIFTLGVSLLPQAFPEKQQTFAIGIFSAFNGAGLALGPFLGGLLITFLNWRWVFWINIPIIVVGISCCLFTLKSAPPLLKKPPIDWLGFILLTTGLGCLIYGLIAGEQMGWGKPEVLILLLVGVVALLCLLKVEARNTHPLLDLSIFKNPLTLIAIYVCIDAGIITSVFLFFDPLYLKIIRQQSAFFVGLTLLAVPLVQIAISLFLEQLLGAFGLLHLLLWALLLALLSAICHMFFTPSSHIIFVLIALMLMGYTWGIGNAGIISAVHTSTPPEKMGTVIGTIFTFWNLSGAISLALASVLFHWRVERFNEDRSQDILQHIGNNLSSTNTLHHLAFMQGFHWVATASAIVMLIFFLLAVAIKGKVKEKKQAR